MFENAKFSFSVEGKELEIAVKRAVSVLSTSIGTPLFIISSDGKAVSVVAANDEAMLKTVLSGKVEGAGAFSFEAPDFLGIIKGRASMTFNFNGQQCEYAGTGKYAGKFNVAGVTKERASALKQRLSEQATSLSIEQESITELKDLMVKSTVKDVYQNGVIISYASVKDRRLTVFSRCSNHFAIVNRKLKTPDLQLSMPSTHFSLVEQVAEGEIAITISHSTLRAESEKTVLVLPFTQAAEQQFELVPTYIANMGSPVYECVLSLEEVAKVCDNLTALHTLNAKLEITPSRKALSFQFATAKGSATDQIKVKGDSDSAGMVAIDPRIFVDCLRVAKGLELNQLTVYAKCVCFSRKDQESGAGSFVVGSRAS